MSSFNRLFDGYVEHSGVSVRKLSEGSGLSRPYISGMRSDKAPSPDYNKMKKLISLLNLSIHEEKELLDAYWSIRIGKENERVFSIVQAMIEKIGIIHSSDVHPFFQHKLPRYQNISNEADVLYHARLLLENQSHGRIKIFVPGIKSEFCHMLSQTLRANESIVVEHIFCLDNSKKTRSVNNIKVLNNLMYCILEGSHYESYYYYDDIKEHLQNGLFPYCIIMEDQLMLISGDFRNGYLSSDNNMRLLYEKKFDVLKQKCSVFVRPLQSAEVYLQTWRHFYRRCPDIDNWYINIEQEPCVAFSAPEWVLDNVLEDADPEIRKMIYDYLDYIGSITPRKGDKGMVSIFTQAGLNDFVRSGYCSALPFEIYRSCTIRERLAVLEAFIESVRSGNIKALLIDEQTFQMPDCFQIATNASGELIMLYQERNNGEMYQLNEQYSREGIVKFVHYFEHSRFVKSEQDTLKALYEADAWLQEKLAMEEKHLPVQQMQAQ